MKIADALKNRLKEDFPKIQRQNLAFAIVYTDGEPQMVYSFKGVDYPGPKADLNHYPSFPVNARYTDSEHRILVDLDKKMTGGFVDEQQKILLYSEQMPCEESCTTAMLRFILEHDETEIKVSYSFKDLDERREAGR